MKRVIARAWTSYWQPWHDLRRECRTFHIEFRRDRHKYGVGPAVGLIAIAVFLVVLPWALIGFGIAALLKGATTPGLVLVDLGIVGQLLVSRMIRRSEARPAEHLLDCEDLDCLGCGSAPDGLHL